VSTETQTKTENKCRYCERVFQRESSLAVHLCEPKRRYREQNETGVQIGLQAYLRFGKFAQSHLWVDHLPVLPRLNYSLGSFISSFM
jgi:hypothetical protein